MNVENYAARTHPSQPASAGFTAGELVAQLHLAEADPSTWSQPDEGLSELMDWMAQGEPQSEEATRHGHVGVYVRIDGGHGTGKRTFRQTVTDKAGHIDLVEVIVQPIVATYADRDQWPPELERCSIGTVVLADTQRLDASFAALEYAELSDNPYVVAVNYFDGSTIYTELEIRDALGVADGVPVVFIDARSERSASKALIELAARAVQLFLTSECTDHAEFAAELTALLHNYEPQAAPPAASPSDAPANAPQISYAPGQMEASSPSKACKSTSASDTDASSGRRSCKPWPTSTR